MTMSATFTTELLLDGRNTGIEVPSAVVDAWGVGRRVPVIVRVGDLSYPSTITPMGGRFLIPFSAERRRATGLSGGETIEVTLVHDVTERTVTVPDDLAAALAAAGLRERFDALAFTHRKEHVRVIEEAKQPETRARRIAAAVAKVGV